MTGQRTSQRQDATPPSTPTRTKNHGLQTGRGLEIASPGSLDRLDPTLSWEAFPRAIDRGSPYADRIGRIADVTYDLMVWQADPRLNEGTLVYARTGLHAPQHKLEVL